MRSERQQVLWQQFFNGKVDGIVLTGGISHDKYVVEKLTEMLSFIAPVTVMAGEFEMEALAQVRSVH